MLDTNLGHIDDADQFRALVANNEKVMVCCGRMGPMCLPVYGIMEQFESKYSDVAFKDMLFDSPVATQTIRSLPEVRHFQGLPFTVYFRDGKVVAATSSIQTKAQITKILDSELA